MAKIDSLFNIIKNNQNWIDILKSEPYCLKIKQNPINENVYCLTYDMIHSKMDLPEVQVARGLVIYVKVMHVFDPERDYKRYGVEKINEVCAESYAFDKFFNVGETNCAKLDWSNPVYGSTKLDGSIIKCRGGHWYTNNGFNADAELPGDLISPFETFQDLINAATSKWSVGLQEKIYQLSKKFTLIFEVLSSENRIVVKYDTDAELVLIGVRNMNTLKEVYIEDFVEENDLHELKLPEIFMFKSLEEAQDFVNNLSANNEGIVLCDKHFNRCKMKTNWYVKLHSMKSNDCQITYKVLYNSLINNNYDDLLSYFPEYNEQFIKIKCNYQLFYDQLSELLIISKKCWKELKVKFDLKEAKKRYAEIAKKSISSFFFNSIKFENYSVNDYLKDLEYSMYDELTKSFDFNYTNYIWKELLAEYIK